MMSATARAWSQSEQPTPFERKSEPRPPRTSSFFAQDLRLETGSMSEAPGQGDRWRANPPHQRHHRAHPVVVDVSVFAPAPALRALCWGAAASS